MSAELNPLVSIIMPTFNGTKYLKTSLESCLNQTYKNFELVIVDDCSTDGTPEVIRSYSDPRIRYIRNATNQKLPRSLNIGFKASKGDYLTWTSDDNYYAETAIEEMLKYLISHHADFVYCDLYNIYDNEQGLIKPRLLEDEKRLKSEDCVGACFMYSRRAYIKTGDYDPDMELVEDYDYWVRVNKNFPLHHIAKPLYYYRYHDLSLWGTKYLDIQIAEFLLKVKYGFLSQEDTNWSLRQLGLKTKGTHSVVNKIISRLVNKPKIDHVINIFLNQQLSCSDARRQLFPIIYGKHPGNIK